MKSLLHTPSFVAFAVIGATMLYPAASRAQGLLGQSVAVSYFYPNLSTLRLGENTQVVTTPGVTYDILGPLLDLMPNQLVITNPDTSSIDLSASAFNGPVLVENGATPVAFTAFTIDPATTITGFDLSRVTIGQGPIAYINLQGLSFSPTDNLTLDFTTGGPIAPIPEVTSAVSFGILLISGATLALRPCFWRRRAGKRV